MKTRKIRPVKTLINSDGIRITFYEYIEPKPHQRTFPNIKGSVSNLGAKAVSLATTGLLKRKHG